MSEKLIEIARKKMNETEFKNMDFEDVAEKQIMDLVYVGAYESSPKKTAQHQIIQTVAEEFELQTIMDKENNFDNAWAILEDETQERAFWEVVNDRIARTDGAN